MYVQDGNRRRRHEEEESWNLLNGAKLEGRGSAALEYASPQRKKKNKRNSSKGTQTRNSAADQNAKQVTAGWLHHI